MSAAEVIAALEAGGVSLYVESGHLRYRGPGGAYTPELRAAVGTHRGELVAFLTAAPKCPRCGSPGIRQGELLIDGKARYDCSRCGRLWYAEPADGVYDLVESAWYDAYPDITEPHYQAVVNADIQAHGYYTPSRRYREPAEDAVSVWINRGLADHDQARLTEGAWF